MISSSSNHFDHISLLKILNNRPFTIPIGEIKAENRAKFFFSISFERPRMQKLYKNAYQMKDEIERIHFKHIFIDFQHSKPFKTDTENNLALFSATFSPIGIVKGLFLNISNKNIWSKWLFDKLNISLNNFQREISYINFLLFGFLSHFSKM